MEVNDGASDSNRVGSRNHGVRFVRLSGEGLEVAADLCVTAGTPHAAVPPVCFYLSLFRETYIP